MKIGYTASRGRFAIAITLAACFSVSAASGKQSQGPSGNIEVKVVVKDSEGNVSFVPSARVQLSGQIVLDAETDELGKYEFVAVPVGSYSIQATVPGLEGAKTLLVKAGKTEEIQVELKPTEVKSSVTVTASEQDKVQPSASASVDEKTLRDAPNVNERFESALPLIPGVVRGPDGRINLKGARATQSGALVNSANVTDPATGSPAINVPIDVVSSVQVISNPYDPQYGKFTGAVSTVATKTSDYQKFHFSIQNIIPRLRDRDGTIAGIGASTPRMTFTSPLVKGRVAVTQSFEYRFVRTPVNSLPALQRDTKLESFDSYTQLDFIITPKQTATASFALYPQKLDFLGLNT